MNPPVASVTDDLWSPVLSLITTTTALGIMFPEGSDTVPRSVLEIVCDCPLQAASRIAISTVTGGQCLRDIRALLTGMAFSPPNYGSPTDRAGIVAATVGWSI